MMTEGPKSHRQQWREFLMSGAFKPIANSSAAILVYLCYLAHANKDGLAWLGGKKIAKAMDISEEKVRRGRRICERFNLIIPIGKLRQNCKVYRVSGTPHIPVGYQSSAPPQVCGLTPHESVGGTPHNGALDTPQVCVTKVEEGRIEDSSKGNAASGTVLTNANAEAMRAALTDAGIAKHVLSELGTQLHQALQTAGIGEPVASELARCERLTPAIVDREAGKARDTGKGPGALVLNLRQLAATNRPLKPAELTRDEYEAFFVQVMKLHPELKGYPRGATQVRQAIYALSRKSLEPVITND